MDPFSSTELCLTHHHFYSISAGREGRIKHFIAPASSFIGGFSRGMVIVKDKSFVGSRAHENRALDTLRHCRAFPGIRFIMGMHLKTSWNWWFKGICVHFPEPEQGLWLCWVLLSGAEVSRGVQMCAETAQTWSGRRDSAPSPGGNEILGYAPVWICSEKQNLQSLCWADIVSKEAKLNKRLNFKKSLPAPLGNECWWRAGIGSSLLWWVKIPCQEE